MKNTTIALIGAIVIAGIYFYKKYEEGMEAQRNRSVTVSKVITKIPRKTNDDVFIDKSCSVPGFNCKDLGLSSKYEEGVLLKDKILYIVKNFKHQSFETRKAYDDLDIKEKVRAQAYAYSVHPKILGQLSYMKDLMAIRIYVVMDDYGELKLLQGFELSKDIAMKIEVEKGRVIPEELFIGGNIKLIDEYFKDKLKKINRK